MAQALRKKSTLPLNTPPPSKIPTIRLIHATPSSASPNPNETLLTPTSPDKGHGDSQHGSTHAASIKSKRSKLNLLSGTKRNDDFSDITRRLGIPPATRGTEIYVDPSNDPDIGEIVVVKKEKARGKLESIRWALGDKTNNSQSSDEKEKSKKEKRKEKENAKPKGEEKDRWWTLGRGRKESKGSKGHSRSKSPGPGTIMAGLPISHGGLLTPPPSAGPGPPHRHNSLDSGAMLNEQWRAGSPLPSPAQVPLPNSRAATPALVVPMPDETKDTRNGGSLAIRAMRSVRSLARIGNWAQVNNPAPARRKKESNDTTSSWEAGEPSVVRSLLRSSGLDGSLRRLRPSKLSSSSCGTQNRLSAESNRLGRPTAVNRLSTLSTVSSLAPVSTYSGDTRSYKTSTDSDSHSRLLSTQSDESEAVGTKRVSKSSSIRWDDNIETVKAKRRGARERRGGTTVVAQKEESQMGSQRSHEARQRGKLSNLFPDVLEPPVPPFKEPPADVPATPPNPSPTSTPPHKGRPRAQSDQLLGHTDRPQGVVILDDGNAVISILNAATSDLASLINRLDLQATPDASGFTPGSQFGSRDPTNRYNTPAKQQEEASKTPSKKSPRESPSVTSLRPYNRVRASSSTASTAESTSNYGPVFSLPDKSTKVDVVPVNYRVPEEDENMEPVFTREPITSSTPASPSVLKPSARSRPNLRIKESKVSMHKPNPSLAALASALKSEPGQPVKLVKASLPATEEGSAQGHSECSSKISYPNSLPPKIKTRNELKKELGYNGTFGDFGGGLALSDEPDSDIPEELHDILKRGSEVDDTFSFPEASPLGRAIGSPSDLGRGQELLEQKPNPPSMKKTTSTSPCPGLPPAIPLPAISSNLMPVFRVTLTDDQDREASLTGSEPHSPNSAVENETKKSFDFTGEINKLNASGEANRLSFLEQLEQAFPDPEKLKSFDIDRNFTVPSFSFYLAPPSADSSLNRSAILFKEQCNTSLEQESASEYKLQHTEPTQFEDIVAPNALSPSIQFANETSEGSVISPLLMQNASNAGVRARSSIVSWVSDDELNWAFQKEGIKSLAGPMHLEQGPLPILRRCRSVSSIVEEDSSVLKSIYGHAIPAGEDVPPVPVIPRRRVESDTSSKRMARHAITDSSHQRTGSEVSFSGFESFSQIRAKFEFMNERSNYFPEIETSQKKHSRQETVFSIASVSSYGQVISGGLYDPFNYGYHSRPPSEDLTGSINDTFSFLKQDPHRKRFSTDSEISGFYFRPGQGQRRGHNRVNDSVASIYSISGPPVSIYNRSHGQSFGHSRTDSWASGSSLAHAYGSQGACAGRSAWSRHCRNSSVCSIEFSAKRLGRPGIGDKMFQSHDPSVPLTSISASPGENAVGDNYSSGLPSQDSIFDGNRTSADSIFDNTRDRSSASSDSIFGRDHHPNLRSHQGQFRPISMLSSESNESRKEDDTMLTMFNGDHVRRRSVGSSFEASPCIRVEKHLRETKKEHFAVTQRTLETIPSVQFGEGRMDLAKKGLLERQSLEASCLVSDGDELDLSVGPPTITLTHRSLQAPRPDSVLSNSSGAATPPLCVSESGGSQSSIDTQHLDAMLTNSTQPTPTIGRLRPRGHGHRRGRSQISSTSAFSSIITIEEERHSPIQSENMLSPAMPSFGASFNSLSPQANISRAETSCVYIVQEEDEETGEVLRRYWALRNEADETVSESQVIWPDTPFSVYALQSFEPPHDPEVMKTMLEHSRTYFGPLPLELRVRKTRSRTSSRASPYPQPQVVPRSRGSSVSPHPQQHETVSASPILHILQSISTNTPARVRKLSINKGDNPTPIKSITRQRVPSNARRAALGWSKRKPEARGDRSFGNKENILTEGTGTIFSPTESLRLSRPRPRGRIR